jgi:hypothetical protein
MDLHSESTNRPVEASLKATYRALLARGLAAGEAANLTAFLHGLPRAGFNWTLPEIEAIVERRLRHAADLRAAAAAAIQRPRTAKATEPQSASPNTTRRPTARRPTPSRSRSRSGGTHVIEPPSS